MKNGGRYVKGNYKFSDDNEMNELEEEKLLWANAGYTVIACS